MADVEERARKREERKRLRQEVEQLRNKTSSSSTNISNGPEHNLNGDPDVSRETSEGLEQKSDAALPDVVKVPSGLSENWERPSTPEIDEAGFSHRKYAYKSYSNAVAAEGGKSNLQKKKDLYANTAVTGRRCDSDEDAEFEPEVQSSRKKTPPSLPTTAPERDDEWTNLSPQRTSERPAPSDRQPTGNVDQSEFYTDEELSEIDGSSDATGDKRVSDEWKSAPRGRVARGVNKPKSKLKKSDSWIHERPHLPEEPILKEPEWLDLVRKRRWRSTVKARFPQTERERIQFERRFDTSKKGLRFNPRGEPTGITGPDMDDDLSMYLLQQRKRIELDDLPQDSGLASSSRSRISSDRSAVSESDYDDSLFDECPRNREYAAEKGILNLSRPPIKGPTKEVHKNLAMERSRQSTMKWRFSIDPHEQPLWAQLPRPAEIEAINDMEGNLEAKFWSSKRKFQTGQFNAPPVLPKPRSRSASASEVELRDPMMHTEEMTPTASRSSVRDMKERLAAGDFRTSTPLPPKPVELEKGYLPRLRDLQQKLTDEAESAEAKTPKQSYISEEELASIGTTRRNISENTFVEKRDEPAPVEKPRMARRRSDAELLNLLASRREEADASAVEVAEEISSLALDFSKAFGKVGDAKEQIEPRGQAEGGNTKEDELQSERTGKGMEKEKQVKKHKKEGKKEQEMERPDKVQESPKQEDTTTEPEQSQPSRATSPEFLVNLKDSEMFVGTEISFEVVVSGEPSPVVQWFLDEHLIENDKRRKVMHHGAVHSVTITDIQLEDEGIYECVATNVAGKVSCDCELLVDD